jgi:transposase
MPAAGAGAARFWVQGTAGADRDRAAVRRRRPRGGDSLAALVQQSLGADPFDGSVYAFRGRKGRLVKCLWHDGIGLCLFVKRIEQGAFPWPMTPTGSVVLSPAQLSLLLEGLEWRKVQPPAWRPAAV